jgi:hypothetical protein
MGYVVQKDIAAVNTVGVVLQLTTAKMTSHHHIRMRIVAMEM